MPEEKKPSEELIDVGEAEGAEIDLMSKVFLKMRGKKKKLNIEVETPEDAQEEKPEPVETQPEKDELKDL